jgi:hypothetical protein
MWIIDFLTKNLIKLRLKKWQINLILHLLIILLEELERRTEKELDIIMIKNLKKVISEHLTNQS